MPDRAEDLGPRSVDGTDWVSQRIRRRSDAFRSNLDRSWRVWPRVNVMCGTADPRAPERVGRARSLRRRHRFGSHRRCGGRRAPRFDADRPPTCLVVARRNNLASSLQTSSSADQRRESHRRINHPTEVMYRPSSLSLQPGRRARCDAERCIGIISPAWHLAVYS